MYESIWVCISGVIFKTENSHQFGFALVASFSKQENCADSGMQKWRHFQNKKFASFWVCVCGVIFKTGNLRQSGYATVA